MDYVHTLKLEVKECCLHIFDTISQTLQSCRRVGSRFYIDFPYLVHQCINQ